MDDARPWLNWWESRGLAEMRVLLWEHWDPLSLRGVAPDDEYDAYATVLASKLRRGRDREDLSAYLLVTAVDDTRELSDAWREQCSHAAQVLLDWYACSGAPGQPMTRVVRINDTDGGVLVSLSAVLAPLRPEADALNWSVLDLREVVPAGDESTAERAIAEVARSPRGWAGLNFSELVAFANGIRQVVDGLFVGIKPNAQPPTRADDDSTLLARSEVLVAAVDSSLWLVSAPDELLTRMTTSFAQVVPVDAESISLSTWGRDY